MVTAEIGDFDEVQCKQHLLNNKYIPEQDTLMDKIFEYHQKHVWVWSHDSKWSQTSYLL